MYFYRISPYFRPVAESSRAALGILITAVAVLALMPLTGCVDRAAAHGRTGPSETVRGSSPAALHPDDPTAAVRRSPLYAEAQRDCRAGRYDLAAGLLDRLAATPGLTPTQAAFCREQRAICLRDAGKPVPAARPDAEASGAPSSMPVLPAPDQADCGPRALVLACHRMNVRGADVASLRSAAGTTGKGTTLAGLARAAKSVGLKAKGEQVDLAALKRLSAPAVAWVDGDHYIAVLSVDGDTATVHDPNHKGEEEMPTGALLARSGGVLLTLAR